MGRATSREAYSHWREATNGRAWRDRGSPDRFEGRHTALLAPATQLIHSLKTAIGNGFVRERSEAFAGLQLR